MSKMQSVPFAWLPELFIIGLLLIYLTSSSMTPPQELCALVPLVIYSIQNMLLYSLVLADFAHSTSSASVLFPLCHTLPPMELTPVSTQVFFLCEVVVPFSGQPGWFLNSFYTAQHAMKAITQPHPRKCVWLSISSHHNKFSLEKIIVFF